MALVKSGAVSTKRQASMQPWPHGDIGDDDVAHGGEIIVLLCGDDKDSQRRDIELALAPAQEL